MLEYFRVTNFKSLINAEIRPAGLNLFVGVNNAGKTNLCHALRFLGLTSHMPLDEAAKQCTAEPWNLLNVYGEGEILEFDARAALHTTGGTLTFAYSIRIVGRKSSSSRRVTAPLTVSSEVLRVSGGEFADTMLLENRDGHVRLLHEKRFLEGADASLHYVDTTAPTDTSMLHRLYDLETNQRANLFKRYLGSWGYYNLDPSQLRSNLAKPMDRALDSAGSNLCSVLYTLHNERPRVEKVIVDAAKLIEPRLDLISYQSPDPEHVYMFIEDKHGHRFGIHNLSDGTLRFLAMCYLIISARPDDSSQGVRPIVMIEEPENGIFVGHLKPLFQKIDPSGEGGQFIFSSHSPYFIDLFDVALEGLHIIKPGAAHSVIVKPDPTRLKEILSNFSLGEMHFRGLLECA